MLSSELERRVVRGRQIVARQQELAAKLGKEFPIALALVETFEKSLVLIEQHYQREVLATAVDGAVGGLSAPLAVSVPICFEPDGTTDPGRDYQQQMRDVARLMELLRNGGYRCELAEGTMH